MMLQDPLPWATSCTLNLRGGVSPSATDRVRIDRFISRTVIMRYLPHSTPSMLLPWLPTLEDLLLTAVSSWPNHVLRPVFPALLELRPRQHSFTAFLIKTITI